MLSPGGNPWTAVQAIEEDVDPGKYIESVLPCKL